MQENEIEVTAPEVSESYAHHGTLHIPEGAAVPTEACVCCGRPSQTIVATPVRNPFNPLTWYTKQTAIEVGLCKKHLDDRRVAVALTFSLLGLGVLLLIVGAINLNIVTIVLGLVAAGVSGLFRARMPVFRTEPEGWVLKVKGAGDKFLNQLPSEDEVTG